MISGYVLRELEKLFPNCYVNFKYNRRTFEISVKKPMDFWTLNDATVLEYDSNKRKISVLKPIDTDILLDAISLLSLVKNVRIEEVKDDETN